jgi:CRP-like cAMP-binding protein
MGSVVSIELALPQNPDEHTNDARLPRAALTRSALQSQFSQCGSQVRRRQFVSDFQVKHIHHSRLFCCLALGDLAEVLCNTQERHFTRGQLFFGQGDTIRHLYLLISGTVKMTQMGPNGQEVVLWLKGQGDFLGLGLTRELPSECRAEALESSCALAWSIPTIEALAERFPALRRCVAEILSEQLIEMQERYRELATTKVSLRVARTLVRSFATLRRQTGQTARLTISREELAQMTGTTVFAVSRLLSDWTKAGIIDARRRAILILNDSKLLAIANGKKQAA